MNKVLRLLAAGTLVFGLASGAVSAETDQDNPCEGIGSAEIVNTGPNSDNRILCEDGEVVEFTCTNGVLINNNTNQEAESGNSDNSDNTNGGDSTTGDVINESETTTNIDATCAAANPEEPGNGDNGDNGGNGGNGDNGGNGGNGDNGGAPVAPSDQPGAGAAQAPAPAPAVPGNVQALPETGQASVATQVGIGAIVLGAIAGAAQLGVSAYRFRIQS